MTSLDAALVLQSAAITVVFVRGSIFDRLRESGPEIWRRFARCPLCTGFWIGLGWHLLDAWQLHGWALHAQTVAVASFACGAVTAVVALAASGFLDVLDGLASSLEGDLAAAQRSSAPGLSRAIVDSTRRPPRPEFPSEPPTDPSWDRRQTAKIKVEDLEKLRE